MKLAYELFDDKKSLWKWEEDKREDIEEAFIEVLFVTIHVQCGVA